MNRSFVGIILAGGIRPAPLCEQVGLPPLCLPMRDGKTLLALWLEALRSTGSCVAVRIVVSDEGHARHIQRCLQQLPDIGADLGDVRVFQDTNRWRGTAGIVSDIAASLTSGEVVIAAEAGCVPPSHPQAGINALSASLTGRSLVGVGIDRLLEPAGIYAFDRAAFSFVPELGYFDIKEQLLPSLFQNHAGARPVVVTPRVSRIRDRASYLQAVATTRNAHPSPADRRERLRAPRVSRSALITGSSLLDSTAAVDSDAIVADSVIMHDVVIGSRAVISRSVVGPGANISPGAVMVETVSPSVWPEVERACEVAAC